MKAADVARIAVNSDAVIRNLQITHCYHELSVAMRQLSGPGANWCTFATWASKQAGRTIRREDLREVVLLRLRETPDIISLATPAADVMRRMGASGGLAVLLDRIVQMLDADGAFERAARAVAAGNLNVFAEIGLEFARYLEARATSDAATMQHFLAALRPGEPPDGQQLLRDAFSAYEAAFATTGAARAQLMLFANLLIGKHEQTRLQPEIGAALNASFDADQVKRRVTTLLLPGAWRSVRYSLAGLFGRRPPLDELLDRLLPLVQRELRRVVTEHAMTLQLNKNTIRLGDDVAGTFPVSLTTLSHPPLLALLQQIDPTANSTRDSGADDWSVLPQRMHLIADLFRCCHESDLLFEQPFTHVQIEALRAGRRPPPPL